MNASMKHGRLVWIVHGERPDEALVHQVDALREAVVVRVDEEGALLSVTKGPALGPDAAASACLGLGRVIAFAAAPPNPAEDQALHW